MLNLKLEFACFFYLALSIMQNDARNPLLLVSFDGLRASYLDDFLRENPASNFKKFIQEGVKADWMKVILSIFSNISTKIG